MGSAIVTLYFVFSPYITVLQHIICNTTSLPCSQPVSKRHREKTRTYMYMHHFINNCCSNPRIYHGGRARRATYRSPTQIDENATRSVFSHSDYNVTTLTGSVRLAYMKTSLSPGDLQHHDTAMHASQAITPYKVVTHK